MTNQKKQLEELFNRRKVFRAKSDERSKTELEEVEGELAMICAKENKELIEKELEGIDCEEGGTHSGRLWKLRKKLFPKSREPPTAMLDQNGNLITDEDQIENLALETYRKRLENRKIKANLTQVKKDKERLCSLRLETAKKNTTPPWTMEQLDEVLKYLKRNKSRDPSGYANEIFRPEVAGQDLKLAILKLMNKIKTEQVYPQALEICDITSIWKRKASSCDFDNYRGIFRLSVFRSILDRLIYNDEYNTIDSNLTDSNVGARKGRNIRDNIFVVNAIVNSVIKGKEEPIDAQLFDVEKCFDALWMEECINDLYEAGLDNDKLNLLYIENQNAQVAVKTPKGVSKRIDIRNIVMQGSVWGSLFCTTTMDKLGAQAYEDESLLYMYKGTVAVPPICMVDDILCIQKCTNSVKSNSVINAFIELKKLTLSKKKCKSIHIGKQIRECADLKVHNQRMENSDSEKYLGDFIEKSGKLKATIADRVAKGYDIVSEIQAIINEVPLGQYKLEIGLKLRQAMLINGMLYNSEAWHAITNDDITALQKVDEIFLRFLLNSQSKAPQEVLHLESGAIPKPLYSVMKRN